MQAEWIGVGHIASHELNVRVHERCDERDVARKSIKLGDQKACLVNSTQSNRLSQLRPIGFCTAFDFREFSDHLSTEARDGFALSFQAKT